MEFDEIPRNIVSRVSSAREEELRSTIGYSSWNKRSQCGRQREEEQRAGEVGEDIPRVDGDRAQTPLRIPLSSRPWHGVVFNDG